MRIIETHGLEENDSGDMDFVCDLLARMTRHGHRSPYS
jgi:hypothetical protein